MAYRTRRAFRSQYELLLAASVLQEAADRLAAPANPLVRPFRWRLGREVERRRGLFAAQLVEFRRETLGLLEPADLLPDVSQLVQAHPAGWDDLGTQAEPAAGGPALTRRLSAAVSGKPSVFAAAAAWAATTDELATRGVTNRPSLIIAEVTALLLTPIAIFHRPERGEPGDAER